MKNLIDSSGWIEYFLDRENADFFDPVIQDSERLIISPLNIYEVSKILHQHLPEDKILECLYFLQTFPFVSMSSKISILASRISLEYKLGMADSILLATVRSEGGVLWTQDKDFEGLPGVKYIQKIY